MPAHPAARALVLLAVVSTPLFAQATLGPYAAADAKYRVVSVVKTSQNMMGQQMDFETSSNQRLSVSVAKAGAAFTLTMTIDSATVSTTSPEPAPDMSDAVGMKFVGDMAPDGKVGTSTVSDRSGAPSTSQFASGFRSILPRLHLGATKGATWADSTSFTRKQNDADVTTETVVQYTLAGDTVVAGQRAWRIDGVSVSKVTGHGNRNGADYSISGEVKGTVTAVVSVAGVLLGESSEGDANLTVAVDAAGITIPIAQKTSTKLEKLP